VAESPVTPSRTFFGLPDGYYDMTEEEQQAVMAGVADRLRASLAGDKPARE
jgi:hypothetical protein